MATWTRASIRDVILGVKAKLVEATGLDETRVIVTVLSPDEVPLFAAPQDVLVRVMGEEPDVDIIDGSGRYDNRRHRMLEVSIRTRLHLDESGSDEARITDETLGHILMEDAVCDALELYWPVNDADDALCGPLRVGTLKAPTRRRDDPSWVYSTYSVRVEYIRDLDTSIVGG